MAVNKVQKQNKNIINPLSLISQWTFYHCKFGMTLTKPIIISTISFLSHWKAIVTTVLLEISWHSGTTSQYAMAVKLVLLQTPLDLTGQCCQQSRKCRVFHTENCEAL